MNKEQIVDIITKELPITGNFAQQRKIVERLADEILQLHSKEIEDVMVKTGRVVG